LEKKMVKEKKKRNQAVFKNWGLFHRFYWFPPVHTDFYGFSPYSFKNGYVIWEWEWVWKRTTRWCRGNNLLW
jgi:hypothetical protein